MAQLIQFTLHRGPTVQTEMSYINYMWGVTGSL